MSNQNTPIPQTLNIYLKTNIAEYPYIKFKPTMIDPKSRETNVLFDPRIKLYKSQVNKGDPKNIKTQFFNSRLFTSLGNRILSSFRYAQKPTTLQEATEKGNVENNIDITLETLFGYPNSINPTKLFKPNNILYLGGKPYSIHTYDVENSNWKIDTNLPSNYTSQSNILHYVQTSYGIKMMPIPVVQNANNGGWGGGGWGGGGGQNAFLTSANNQLAMIPKQITQGSHFNLNSFRLPMATNNTNPLLLHNAPYNTPYNPAPVPVVQPPPFVLALGNGPSTGPAPRNIIGGILMPPSGNSPPIVSNHLLLPPSSPLSSPPSGGSSGSSKVLPIGPPSGPPSGGSSGPSKGPIIGPPKSLSSSQPSNIGGGGSSSIGGVSVMNDLTDEDRENLEQLDEIMRQREIANLSAGLPSNWTVRYDPIKKRYFYNDSIGKKTQWKRPDSSSSSSSSSSIQSSGLDDESIDRLNSLHGGNNLGNGPPPQLRPSRNLRSSTNNIFPPLPLQPFGNQNSNNPLSSSSSSSSSLQPPRVGGGASNPVSINNAPIAIPKSDEQRENRLKNEKDMADTANRLASRRLQKIEEAAKKKEADAASAAASVASSSLQQPKVGGGSSGGGGGGPLPPNDAFDINSFRSKYDDYYFSFINDGTRDGIRIINKTNRKEKFVPTDQLDTLDEVVKELIKIDAGQSGGYNKKSLKRLKRSKKTRSKTKKRKIINMKGGFGPKVRRNGYNTDIMRTFFSNKPYYDTLNMLFRFFPRQVKELILANRDPSTIDNNTEYPRQYYVNETNSLQVVPNSGGGNCLFEAVAQGINIYNNTPNLPNNEQITYNGVGRDNLNEFSQRDVRMLLVGFMTDASDPVKVAYVNDVIGRQQQLVVNTNQDIANLINGKPYNGHIVEVDYLRLVNNAYNRLNNKFLINKVNNLPVGSAIDTPFYLVDHKNQADLEAFIYNPLYWGDQIAIHMIQQELQVALLVIIKSQANVDTCYTPLDDPSLQAYDKYMFLFLDQTLNSEHYELIKFRYRNVSKNPAQPLFLPISATTAKQPTDVIVSIFNENDRPYPPLYILFYIFGHYYFKKQPEPRDPKVEKFFGPLLGVFDDAIQTIRQYKDNAENSIIANKENPRDRNIINNIDDFIQRFQNIFSINIANPAVKVVAKPVVMDSHAHDDVGPDPDENNPVILPVAVGVGAGAGGVVGPTANIGPVNATPINPAQNLQMPAQHISTLSQYNSRLGYYIVVDIDLYPGTTIPVVKRGVLACNRQYNNIKKEWDAIFGNIHVRRPLQTGYNTNTRKKTDNSRSGKYSRSNRNNYDRDYDNDDYNNQQNYSRNNRYNRYNNYPNEFTRRRRR